MSVTVSEPHPDIMAIIGNVMKEFHPLLIELGVRVGVVMASNDKGPAVKGGGFGVPARIGIVNLKDRLKKQYDAELTIDLEEWESLEQNGRHQKAMIDHYLSFLKPVANSPKKVVKGAPAWKRDDLDRPILKKSRGDWNGIRGFVEGDERHGDFAIEYRNIKSCQIRADAAKSVAKEIENES